MYYTSQNGNIKTMNKKYNWSFKKVVYARCINIKQEHL